MYVKIRSYMQKAIEFIKNRRKVQNLTQQDLANKLNISLRTYQSIEYGNMSAKEFYLLGVALGFRILIIPEECDLI